MPAPELIDSHCHLDMPAFDEDRDLVLAACHEAGVRELVIPGYVAAHWDRILELCADVPGLHPALGLHPGYCDHHREEDLDRLSRLVRDLPLVAIGEIGLDFYEDDPDRDTQVGYFEAQLALAEERGLPVVLHVRKAHDEVLKILERTRVVGGIAHAFNGSQQQAERYIALNFCLGLGGMLTYERSHKLRRLAAALPAENIVLETDAPDLTVASHQYERNSPAYLPEVLTALAEIRSEEPEALARITTANARRCLRLPTPV